MDFRALNACQHIFSADGGTPLHYLEAVGLEKIPEEITKLETDVALRIAHAESPVDAAQEILDAFLVVPVQDNAPEQPDAAGGLSEPINVGGALSEEDKKHDGSKVTSKAALQHDVRSLVEVLRAVEVVGLAVLLSGNLVATCRNAVTKLHDIADKMRTDTTARISIRTAADTLQKRCLAAGTIDPGESEENAEEAEVASEAFRADDSGEGRWVDRSVMLLREWRVLHRRNLTTIPKERYIAVNLERLKAKDQNQ